MDWFRSHHGAPTDPKWRAIAKRANCRPGEVAAIFWAMLDFASQHTDRGSVIGFDAEIIAAAYDFEEDTILAVIAVLEEKGITQNGRLAQWERRQPKREDDSTERVRAFRKRSETQRNAPEQSRTEEIRADHSEAIASAAKPLRPLDLDKAYWETGKAFLEANGVPPQRSGGLLGKWRREFGREAVVAALARAEAESPSETVAFIEGCLRSTNGKRFGPATGIAAGFADALQARARERD